jgi:hypothetical protein
VLVGRLKGGRPVTSSPSSSTVPSLGSSNPAIIRSVVVFPHPDGPSIVKKWPRGMSRSMSRTAAKSPKRFVTPRRLTLGAAASVPPWTPRLMLARKLWPIRRRRKVRNAENTQT